MCPLNLIKRFLVLLLRQNELVMMPSTVKRCASNQCHIEHDERLRLCTRPILQQETTTQPQSSEEEGKTEAASQEIVKPEHYIKHPLQN
ncbi:hypothetical protein scyTo_0022348, partial [Scyliorhinus torazame]|nr:hypothetical protein [Scyliorhinus torazame]